MTKVRKNLEGLAPLNKFNYAIFKSNTVNKKKFVHRIFYLRIYFNQKMLVTGISRLKL